MLSTFKTAANFRVLLINFGTKLIKSLMPIRIKQNNKVNLRFEIKPALCNFVKRCPHMAALKNHLTISVNKDKKRYRNIARARDLLKRWQS